MRSKDDPGERRHRRALELLPWYANGTLEDIERRVVEIHLAACARCREELAADRRLGESLRQTPETAPAPHPAQFARLLERLDGDRETTGWRGALRGLGGLGDLLAATPRAVRWTLAAQFALVLLLGGLGGGLLLLRRPQAAPPPAVYQTLSDPAPAAPAATARLRVVFAPGTSEQEMRNLLLGIRGQITAGPSPLGVYTVDVPAGPDAVADVLAHLRTHEQVSLAEPVAP
jgi:anti-sigma factor RsiW